MKALHIRLEGFSATYPYPFLKSGTQLTMPLPPFSSIFGNLSACAGRPVGPSETAIAVEFRSRGTGIDLETTRRLKTDKTHGKLSRNPELGIAKREFHVAPQLDLYLTATEMESIFLRPVAVPCLGRSQDLAWITIVRRIELVPVDSGQLGPTLVPFPNPQVGGLISPPLADYFRNDSAGFVRTAGRYSRYQFVAEGTNVRSALGFDLYRPDDSDSEQHAVVLHQFSV